MDITQHTQKVRGALSEQVVGFLNFVKKQGVVTLAIGFILGGAVTKVVQAFATDIVNPLLGLLLGSAQGLSAAVFTIGNATILWGHFVYALIDFVIIAAVIYYGVALLRLDTTPKTP